MHVSIITPAYNVCTCISDTILSAINQSFTDWEMIIVDDCSTDNTYNIASRYAQQDSRIVVVRHTKNAGVAAARNTALDRATGEYVAFLDSDDLWLPDKLEKQLSFMESNNYAITYTRYQIFSTDSNTRGKIINVPPKMTYKSIFYNTAIACLTVMVNRELVGKFHMPIIDHTEDQCTWQEILNRGYVAFALQENLALYRVGHNSLTSNKLRSIIKQWHTYRKFYKFTFFKSLYYFLFYITNAVIKHI